MKFLAGFDMKGCIFAGFPHLIGGRHAKITWSLITWPIKQVLRVASNWCILPIVHGTDTGTSWKKNMQVLTCFTVIGFRKNF